MPDFLRKQGARISARKKTDLLNAIRDQDKFLGGNKFPRGRKIYVIKQDDRVLKERGQPAYKQDHFLYRPYAILKKAPAVDGENDFR